jgi:uncharacterized RDD family membrane protein YckC
MKTFSARETLWLQELDGIELAGFWRRALAFLVDWTLVGVAFSLLISLMAMGYIGIRHHQGRPVSITDANSLNTVLGDKVRVDANNDTPPPNAPKSHIVFSAVPPPCTETPRTLLGEAANIFTDIVVPILYFGLFLWQGNGRTPGKRLFKIRVVSLVHTHMTFWHSVERALGYGAAALEGGFGFLQYFIHPYRRCAQDRLAETIVVTERSYQQRFPKALGTPSEADTLPQ